MPFLFFCHAFHCQYRNDVLTNLLSKRLHDVNCNRQMPPPVRLHICLARPQDKYAHSLADGESFRACTAPQSRMCAGQFEHIFQQKVVTICTRGRWHTQPMLSITSLGLKDVAQAHAVSRQVATTGEVSHERRQALP